MCFSQSRSLVLALFAAAVIPLYGQTNCEQYGTVPVDNNRYFVQVNRYNDPNNTLCVTASGTSFVVSQSTVNVPTNEAPAAYPSFVLGCHWSTNNCSVNSGLPLQISNLGSINTTFSFSAASGIWNNSYDAWINKSPTINGQADGGEVMVWNGYQGTIQPASTTGQKATTVIINGVTWDVWLGVGNGSNVSWQIITYVRTSPANSGTLDLKPFIDDAVARGSLLPSWWLTSVQYGFEIWNSGQGLAINSFSASVTPATSGSPGGTPSTGSTPTVTAITPTSGNPGSQTRIDGSGFGPNPGTVLFGGTPAPINAWSPSSVTVTVPNRPAGATTVVVLVPSNSVAFTVSGSSIVYVNGYPTVNGHNVDCNGNIDDDPAHHTTDPKDTDPAHHVGQNCPAGSWVATHQ